ncbi:MAG TPA: hypothetical protein VNS32_22570 [Flavisolibacter sp.]|nr:hypothetical protein [Flavisolibacter sp.]
MKKLLAFILIMVYGLSSTGMTVHFHYCCGKLDKVSLEPVKGKCEGAAGMKNKSCCDSKQVTLKLKREQQSGKWIQHSFHSEVLLPEQEHLQVVLPRQSKKLLPEIFAPPPLQKDLLSLYCVYKI